MKYAIIDSTSIYHLVEEVKKMIERGWQPIGGAQSNGHIFFQTMIKKENENKTPKRVSPGRSQ